MTPSRAAPDESERLSHIHGASVLVKSAQDRRDPPIAMRGSLDTRSTPNAVKVILEFPDMGVAPAYQSVITLPATAVDQLLQGASRGVYEITVPDSLDSQTMRRPSP